MTREDIEKASKDYQNTLPYCDDRKVRGYFVGAKDGFIKGTEWRINSIWHYVNEIPRDNSLILCKTKDDDYFLYGKKQRYYKEMSEDVEMWAYIEDLIPTN